MSDRPLGSVWWAASDNNRRRLDQDRSAERRSLGYSTVLMPDGLQLPSPFLAMAAAVADIPGRHVRGKSARLRTPRAAASRKHTLTS